MRLIATVVIAALWVVRAGAQAPLTLEVSGAARQISATELQKLPRDSARMTFHGQPPITYHGVSLAGVLRVAGVRSDSLRGPALSTRLVVESSDGYRVVLTLADLDQSLGGRHILLADRLNGKPLPADEAPWRLIIVGDQRPSRSARQVVRIRVIAEPR